MVQSVVRISDLNQATAGTGYIIAGDVSGRYLILTANHVADGHILEGHTLRIEFAPFGRSNSTTLVRPLQYDLASDQSLLAVTYRRRLPALKVCPAGLIPGARRFPVLAVGFPGSRLTVHETETLGATHFRSPKHGTDGLFWRLEDKSAPGISGAPLCFSLHGEPCVIGTWWGSAGNEGRCSYASELQEFLSERYAYLFRNDRRRVVPVSVGGTITIRLPDGSKLRLKRDDVVALARATGDLIDALRELRDSLHE